MPGSHKTEHVTLQVRDLDGAVDFYKNVFGLGVLARDDERVYLGCGFDENYDLAVQEGPPGIDHFAVRVDDPETLDIYEHRLEQNGIDSQREAREPGQEHGLRFKLPSEITMELVVVEDKSYKHYYEMVVPDRGGIAPLDLNHYNFHSPDVERDAKFLIDLLDFKVSAVIDDWNGGAFLRQGDFHHDVAIFNHEKGPERHASHHHTGFSVSSVDHMVQLIDRVVMHGGTLELGIGRHFGGDNIYAYFQAPDGHRIELVTQMTELDDNTPMINVDNTERAVSAWEEELELPESWLSCSGLVK
jgi:catechol 2,3-dioxygenase